MIKRTVVHRNSLEEEAKYILEESRIVVPGVQALFGFQLIAVFNDGFEKKLSDIEQLGHITAILFVALSMMLVLAPAAIHRLAEPNSVSKRFVKISTRLLTWALTLLRLGVCTDFYLVCRVVTKNTVASFALTGFLFLVSFVLWSAFPRILKRMTRQFAEET